MDEATGRMKGYLGGGVRMEELKKYKQQSHCLNKTFSPELSEFYDETKCLLSSVGAVLPQVNAKWMSCLTAHYSDSDLFFFHTCTL